MCINDIMNSDDMCQSESSECDLRVFGDGNVKVGSYNLNVRVKTKKKNRGIKDPDDNDVEKRAHEEAVNLIFVCICSKTKKNN